jgi:uncharacterized membrane protein
MDKKPAALNGTWHDKHKRSRGFGDRVADTIAAFVGSWTFIILHAVWFSAWMFFKVEPFPYGLLTMMVSLEAIFLSTFIMISQNRQGDRDRDQAQADYDTNKVAKEEIERLQKDLARIEIEKLDKLIALLEKGN